MNTLLKFGLVKDLVQQEIQVCHLEIGTVSILYILVDGELDTIDATEECGIVTHLDETINVLDKIYVKLISLVQNEDLKNKLIEMLNETRQTPGNITIDDETLEKMCGQITDLEIFDECMRFKQSSDEITEMVKSVIFISKNSSYRLYYDYLATLKIADDKKAVESKQFLEDELDKVNNAKVAAKRFIDEPVKDSETYVKILKSILIIPPGVLRGIDIGFDGAVLVKILQRAERIANYFLQKIGGDTTVVAKD